MAPPALQKRTIVRPRGAPFRGLVRSAELIAPRLTGRYIYDLWFRVPPVMTQGAIPPDGVPFTVSAQGAEVHGYAFGQGPTVYLVHGWGGRGSQLNAFVNPLVATGHRVVWFDAPAHGDSPHGPAGPGRSHGVEFAKALDAVFARFGPAEALIAHSMGTISTYLTLRFGWLGIRSLVLVAPMVGEASLLDQFQATLGFGHRTRRAFDQQVNHLVGVPVAEFDAILQASHIEPLPTLVIHDMTDRQTPYTDAQRLVQALPDARLVTTDGLGHRKILRDPQVISQVVEFVGSGNHATGRLSHCGERQVSPDAAGVARPRGGPSRFRTSTEDHEAHPA